MVVASMEDYERDRAAEQSRGQELLESLAEEEAKPTKSGMLFLVIPPATKLGGGILESPCPSVRLSVRLSVDARLGKMVSSA